MLAIAGCSSAYEGVLSRAERGIAGDAEAAETLLISVIAQTEEPVTAQNLIDGQVVAVLALTQEERDALTGGSGRVAFGLEATETRTTVDVFVETQVSTQQGLERASSDLFGCVRITVDRGASKGQLDDLECPSYLSPRYDTGAKEVSVEELVASQADQP